MPLFATLTLVTVCLQPQGTEPPAPQPLLTPAEQKSLHDKLADLIRLFNEKEMARGPAREKATKAYAKAKEAFEKERERCEKKGNLLKAMPDLQAIFANCFQYETKSPASIRKVEPHDKENPLPPYWLSVPKGYKADKPNRVVLLVPGLEDNGWFDGQRWFENTWDKSASAADTIFHVPIVDKKVDLAKMPDYGQTGAEEEEKTRNAQLLASFGEVQRTYNVDRARVFLDVGKGASAYALRVATHFPGTFAGVVLRQPDAEGTAGLRLGSLNGMPVLLLGSEETKAACSRLKERIDAQAKDSCTILATTDAYPFKAATPEIEKWMAGVKRSDVNRKHVVLEPNDDRWCSAYWVRIDTMETIHTAPPDKKPRLEVEADRASNRITVKAVGVESFALRLNDALVDLDKEFTVVVNDKAMTQKLTRDFNRMLEFVNQRFDGEFLFPVEFRARVPKPEEKPN